MGINLPLLIIFEKELIMMNILTEKDYYKYATDVINGDIVAGNHIKLACKRFLADLEDDRFEFRESAVDYCIKFISIFKHYTGKHAGKNFELMP